MFSSPRPRVRPHGWVCVRVFSLALSLQPRKKKPFDRKNAQKFVVMPRSLQDPVMHQEGGSQFVLVPVAPPAAGAGAFDDATTAMGSVRSRKSAVRAGMYDEVDELVRCAR